MKLTVRRQMEGFRHDGGYFDHTGLIYDGDGDPGLGVNKLAYFTYRKMTEKLGGADWPSLAMLDGPAAADHVFLFGVWRDGLPLRIAWWDWFDDPEGGPGATKTVPVRGLPCGEATVTDVVPPYETGEEVPDSSSTKGAQPDGWIQPAAGGGPPARPASPGAVRCRIGVLRPPRPLAR